nr:hypothetical protein CFP56_58051 [Quercus suber]
MASEGRALEEFLVEQRGLDASQGSESRGNWACPPPLGIIEVIHALSRGMSFRERKGVLRVTSTSEVDSRNRTEKKLKRTLVLITFDEVDFEGIT